MRSQPPSRHPRQLGSSRPRRAGRQRQASPGPALSPTRTTTIITRPEALTPTLRAAMAARGHSVLVQPLLSIEPLRATVPAPSRYQAVVATSATAVDILGIATSDRQCRLFVVGDAGVRAAARAGFARTESAVNAQAQALAIRSSLDPACGPLLYVAGRHRARDLRRLLPDFQIELVEVYAAAKLSRLTPAVRRALKRRQVASIAFYSARAADAFVTAAKRGEVMREAQQAQAVCLSPRIAARLKAQGWRRVWAARVPTADHINAHLLGRRVTTATDTIPEAALTANAAKVQAMAEEKTTPSPNPRPDRPEDTATTEVASADPVETAPEVSHEPSGRSSGPGWLALAAVAVLAAIGGGYLWHTGQESRDIMRAEIQDLRASFNDLEQNGTGAKLEDLSSRVDQAMRLAEEAQQQVSSAGGANADELAGLKANLNDLQSLASQADEARSGQTETLKRLQSEAENLVQQIGGLQSNSEAQEEARAQLQQSIAALQQQVTQLSEQVSSIEEWRQNVKPESLAEGLVALSDLRQVVDSGAPFKTALEHVQNVVPAAAGASGQWVSMADQGIPSLTELSERLDRIAHDLPASPKKDESVVDSAVNWLMSGVRIENEDVASEDPRDAAITEAEQALGAGDAKAAAQAVEPFLADAPDLAAWHSALSARIAAEETISGWEEAVLKSSGGSN
jgi:uroporphyrinogen-III synthase